MGIASVCLLQEYISEFKIVACHADANSDCSAPQCLGLSVCLSLSLSLSVRDMLNSSGLLGIRV